MWLSAFFPYVLTTSLFSLLCSALALAFSAIGAAETVTGTKSLCYLLFIWKCLLLRICVCWLAVHRSMFICACLHEWLLYWYFLFQESKAGHVLKLLILCFFFVILESTFFHGQSQTSTSLSSTWFPLSSPINVTHFHFFWHFQNPKHWNSLERMI